MRFPYTPELKPFQIADDNWAAEMQRVFGKDACQARYAGAANATEELKRLHAIRENARIKWHQSATPRKL